MNPWLFTIPAFIIFCLGSYCTYTREVRESSYFIPLVISLSLVSSWIWAVVARNLSTTNHILFFSLIWDILMVLAYYAGPILLKENKFSWQVYASAALTVTGICWFKIATSE